MTKKDMLIITLGYIIAMPHVLFMLCYKMLNSGGGNL